MDIKLSSSKNSHGLAELLSSDNRNFWATEGTLPHYIEISFPKKTFVTHIDISLNYNEDDSYTPSNIEIRTGMFRESTKVVTNIHLDEPDGVTCLKIDQECFIILIIILANHQDGRDSKIRNLKVFSGDEELKVRMPYY